MGFKRTACVIGIYGNREGGGVLAKDTPTVFVRFPTPNLVRTFVPMREYRILLLVEELENQLGHLPKFQKLHIYSISPSGVENELIFTLWAAVSEIRADFQNCHIWAWNLVIGQYARSRTYTLSTPGGQHWAYFCSMCSGFRDTGWFQNCHIWVWNLTIGQSARSCTYTLFLPQGVEIELVLPGSSTGSGFRETGRFSKLPYLGMKLGKWPKFQKLQERKSVG